ncbi:MAG: right-handed parallel beta-helix repeat-containing protein [Chloroflexota bacterium]
MLYRYLLTVSMLIVFVTGCLGAFAHPRQVHAAVSYYVAPDGNDSNAGTIDTPFRTLQHAIDHTPTGSTIYLRGGRYVLDENITTWGTYQGTAATPNVIRAYQDETPILDGSRLSAGQTVLFLKNVEHVEIRGLTIEHSPGHGIEVVHGHHMILAENDINKTQGMGIRVRGYAAYIQDEGDTTRRSEDVLITHNQVSQTNLSNSGDAKERGNWGGAIQAWNAEQVSILHNHVFENYGEGIGLSTVRDGVVADNRVSDSFSVQIYLDNASHSTVARNFIYTTKNPSFFRGDYPAQGIGLANEVYDIAQRERYHLNHNTIHNNIVVGGVHSLTYGLHGGIHHDGDGQPRGVKNTVIAHNTFYGSHFEMIKFAEDPHTTNVMFANNIFYQTSSSALIEIDEMSGLQFTHNLWYGGDAEDAASPADQTSDPLLNNPGGYDPADYQMQTNSPIRDAGIGDYAPDTDYFGNPRPVGDGFDIGAYEVGSLSADDPDAGFIMGIYLPLIYQM